MSSQLERNKQLIKIILLTQLVVIILAVVLALITNANRMVGVSILLGGLINIVVQTYASYRMLSGGRFKESATLLKNLLFAEMMKFLLAITLLTLLLVQVTSLVPVYAILGFIMSQLSASFAPLFVKKLYG